MDMNTVMYPEISGEAMKMDMKSNGEDENGYERA
jgi:hypothetical protein